MIKKILEEKDKVEVNSEKSKMKELSGNIITLGEVPENLIKLFSVQTRLLKSLKAELQKDPNTKIKEKGKAFDVIFSFRKRGLRQKLRWELVESLPVIFQLDLTRNFNIHPKSPTKIGLKDGKIISAIEKPDKTIPSEVILEKITTERSSQPLLEYIETQMENITPEDYSPRSPAQEEKVIGELNEETKKMVALSIKASKEENFEKMSSRILDEIVKKELFINFPEIVTESSESALTKFRVKKDFKVVLSERKSSRNIDISNLNFTAEA